MRTQVIASTWNWGSFRGTAQTLKYARRDLPNLERVIGLVPVRRVAVQAGGNLGIYAKRLAEAFEHVITFEPAADLYRLMQQNAPEGNITRYLAALGENHDGVSLSRIRRDGKRPESTHEGLTHVAGPGPIPTLLLDDLALPICDLLCLDIEGWELYALRGAVETIRRCRPVLCIEINKSLQFVGLSQDQVRGFILALGYRFVVRLGSDEVFVPQEWAA